MSRFDELCWPRSKPRVLLGFEILCAWCRPLVRRCRDWWEAVARKAVRRWETDT